MMLRRCNKSVQRHGCKPANANKPVCLVFCVATGIFVAVEVREKGKQLALVLEAIKSAERDVPDYLSVDHNKMTASLSRIPALSDVPYPVTMEPNLVVEFYSR